MKLTTKTTLGDKAIESFFEGSVEEYFELYKTLTKDGSSMFGCYTKENDGERVVKLERDTATGNLCCKTKEKQ